MSKFEYRRSATVSLAAAKRGRAVVYTVRGLALLVPAAAVVALIMLTPLIVWGSILGFVAVLGTMMFLIEHGEDVTDWYKDHRRNYNRAKAQGVKDE